eukprot:2255981-Rhodomonas_salina.2
MQSPGLKRYWASVLCYRPTRVPRDAQYRARAWYYELRSTRLRYGATEQNCTELRYGATRPTLSYARRLAYARPRGTAPYPSVLATPFAISGTDRA